MGVQIFGVIHSDRPHTVVTFQPTSPSYHSSSPSSSTFGATYCRCCTLPVLICVSVPVVVAVVGATWPVAAAKVALVATDREDDLSFFFFFFSEADYGGVS